MASEVCSIYLLRDGVLELFATVGLNQSAVHVTKLAMGEGLVGTIAQQVAVLNLDEASRHPEFACRPETGEEDRKSTRLNSSHSQISYAVFCLKKKKKKNKKQHKNKQISTIS